MKKRFKKVYVEITNVCNLKCKFCPDTNRNKSFIKVSEFNMVLERIKDYTNLIALHVKGEPLMHPEIDEILKLSEENGIMVNITTNGTELLNSISKLKHLSLRQINISLHALKENEGIDVRDYLKNVFEAVNVIRKFNSNIYISYRFWNLNAFENNDKNSDILLMLEKEYNKENLINILKSNQFYELAENVFINQDIEFTWPDINGNFISEEGTCQGLRSQIAILVNGDVVPCCLDQDANIKLGNIFEETLEDILDKDLTKEIINGFECGKIIHTLCKKCGYRTKF